MLLQMKVEEEVEKCDTVSDSECRPFIYSVYFSDFEVHL